LIRLRKAARSLEVNPPATLLLLRFAGRHRARGARFSKQPT
jgi:hypothetical protein